jgi:hypothetical protein
MAWKAVIAGVDKTTSLALLQPIAIERTLNERAMANFVTKPGYVPSRFATVELYDTDGTTVLFGGVVLKRSIAPFQQRGGTEPYFTQVDCGDYFTYFDWAYISLTYSSSVTLKTVLTDLVAALPATYGITLDAGQVTGPTLAAFTWERKRASDAVRELTDRTGYVALVSPLKALKMFVPGTDAAPFALTDASPHCLSFDWSDSDRIPANDVTVIAGPAAVASTTKTWIQAGGATSWVTDIPAAIGAPPPGYVTVNGVFRTVGPGASYTWNDATSTLSLGTDPTPTNGWSIVLVYNAQFPFTVTATSGATPVIQFQQAYPDVTEYAPASEIATGLLAQLNQQPREINVSSLSSGWALGQALTVALTARMTASFVLTGLSLVLQVLKGSQRWVATFPATESTTYQGSYLDQWRALTGGSSSGISSVSGGGSSTTVTVLSSPVYMGGSYTQSVTNPTVKALIQGAVPYVATSSFTGRLRVNLKARDAGVGVKAIISDGTTDVATSIVTSQTFSDVTVIVPIVSGQTYRVYIQNDAAGDGYVGYAQLEAA